ncbi:MAG: VWA containing CoxE family protein [Lachnospiraceae bacterium]|nr:VWA containing CoxE family protein [Lachnospiraceae bacterium]
MFTPFFYILKSNGLDISTTEWLTLMDGLDKGLAHSNFTDFYYLCRTVLVKNEGDYDKLDAAFLEYFQNIKEEKLNMDKIDQWLHKGAEPPKVTNPELYRDTRTKKEATEVHRMFRERLGEQHTEHNGGNYWIGTGGGSEFGKYGRVPGGIQLGDHSGMKTAFAVLGERQYQDFRRDKKLTMRQFQVAFRELRQYSRKLDLPKTELDIDGTIDSTCNQGGYLKLEFQQPRKNTVKLMLLFDSGGSMYPHMELCNELFQSVNKANHFKDVKTFYFHNCIYAKLYKTPECVSGDWIDTTWAFKNYDKDYKVIIVGDAGMAEEEYYDKNGNYSGPNGGLSGHEWIQLFKKKYPNTIWLNPRYHGELTSMYWMESERAIKEIVDMYPLTVDGLKEGIKKLMSDKG